MLAWMAVSSENGTKTLVSSNMRLQSPTGSNTFCSGAVVMASNKTENKECGGSICHAILDLYTYGFSLSIHDRSSSASAAKKTVQT